MQAARTLSTYMTQESESYDLVAVGRYDSMVLGTHRVRQTAVPDDADDHTSSAVIDTVGARNCAERMLSEAHRLAAGCADLDDESSDTSGDDLGDTSCDASAQDLDGSSRSK